MDDTVNYLIQWLSAIHSNIFISLSLTIFSQFEYKWNIYRDMSRISVVSVWKVIWIDNIQAEMICLKKKKIGQESVEYINESNEY